MDILKARQELILGKTIYDMKLKVADYGRVSTDKYEQLNSLDNQINYFHDFIDGVKQWVHVGSYIDEGISGTLVSKREEFQKMIEDARLGKIDLIVTKEVSRFARNTIDSIKYTQLLLQYGVIVLFLSDNINTIYPDSEFRLTLMASMAQDEVRKLSERVKFGIQRSVKERKLGGGSLYGYHKKDCKLIINNEEAKAVEILFSLYSSGQYGFKRISEELATKGYKTRKGKIFSDTTLKKMLTNPRYKGFYTANMSEVKDYKTHKKVMKPKSEWIIEKDLTGNVPPIVSEELWDKANKIYIEKLQQINKNILNKDFFLENRKYTSKILCSEHNVSFIRSASGKRKNNPVWQCRKYLKEGIKGCQTPRLFEKHLDKIFIRILDKIVNNKEELLKHIITDYMTLIKESESSFDLNKKLEELLNIKERIFEMSLKKLISDKDFIKKNQKVEKDILTIKNKTKDTSLVNYKKLIKNISTEINNYLDLEKNIEKYFDIFIDKVLVTKINSSRKHLKLTIFFNYKRDNIEIEYKNIDYTNKI